MKNRNIAYIGVAVLIILYLITNFEIKQVQDINYKVRYGLSSKDPFGLYVLHILMEQKYGENAVKDYPKSRINEIEDVMGLDTTKDFRGYLLIQISNKIYYDKYEAKAIENFLAKGGKILLSSKDIDVDGEEINITSENSISVPDSMSFTDAFRDTTYSYLNYYKNPHDYMQSDELGIHYFTPEDECDETLLQYYETPFVTKHFNNKVILHGFPNLFTNIGAKQAYYLDHLNIVLGDQSIRHIIFIKGSGDSIDDQGFLNVIFRNRGLKYAYITLIFGGLILLIFNTKRVQNAIEIQPDKPNQTLAYANTLAQLYKASNKHHFLVIQMKENFQNYVQEHYHLKPTDANYQIILARKAKVEENTIKNIFREFDELSLAGKANEYSLTKLNNIITSFKKISNGG